MGISDPFGGGGLGGLFGGIGGLGGSGLDGLFGGGGGLFGGGGIGSIFGDLGGIFGGGGIGGIGGGGLGGFPIGGGIGFPPVGGGDGDGDDRFNGFPGPPTPIGVGDGDWDDQFQPTQQIGGTLQQNNPNNATYTTSDGWTIDMTGSYQQSNIPGVGPNSENVTITPPSGKQVNWSGFTGEAMAPGPYESVSTGQELRPEIRTKWQDSVRTLHLENNNGTVVEGEADPNNPGQIKDIKIFDAGQETQLNFNKDGTVSTDHVFDNPNQTQADEAPIDSRDAANFGPNGLSPYPGIGFPPIGDGDGDWDDQFPKNPIDPIVPHHPISDGDGDGDDQFANPDLIMLSNGRLAPAESPFALQSMSAGSASQLDVNQLANNVVASNPGSLNPLIGNSGMLGLPGMNSIFGSYGA